MTQKTNQNPWTMDVRVRERNLKSGALGQKDLEKYLAQLPDLAEQAEPFGLAQPALTEAQAASEVAVAHDERGEELAAPSMEATGPITNGEGSL